MSQDFYRVEINADSQSDTTSTEGETAEGTTETTTEGAPERPSWLPEKFKSPEEMAKAYEALEKKQGSAKPKTKQPVEPVADDKGKVDMAKVNRELQSNGELSTETRKALETAGINADEHVRGRQAIALNTRREVAAVVGGEEQLDNVRVWAETNLSADEIAVYDGAVATGNLALSKLLLQGINARYVEANGAEPKLQNSETVPSSGSVKPFMSNHEVVKAMQDPRYKKGDRAYIKSVENRLAISKVF